MSRFHIFLWIIFIFLCQVSLDYPTTLGVLMVIFPVVFSIIIILGSKKIIFDTNLKLHCIAFFIAIFSGINVILTGDVKVSLIVLILRIIVIYFFVAILIINYYQKGVMSYIYIGTYVSFLLIVMLSFVYPNYFQGAFSGIYKNPNTLGLIAVEFLIINLAHLYSILERRFKKVELIIPISFLILASYVMLITESRTAFLVFCIMLLSFSLILLIKFFTRKYLKRMFIFLVFLLTLAILGIYLINKNSYLNILYNNLINQFLNRNTDFTAGRVDLWKHALNEYSFLGNGIYYFEKIYGNPPHNVYLSILTDFGLVPGVLFILYFIYICYLLFKNIISESFTVINIFCLLTIIAFFSVSLVESIRLHYLFYLLFVVGGILSLHKFERESDKIDVKEDINNERN